MKDKKNSVGVRLIFGVIAIIFVSLLLINVIRNVNNGSFVSFTSFLDLITNVPQLSFNNLKTIYISGDWVILDGLRVFLNQLVTPLNVVIFLGSNLWNCLFYILYFVKFLFVG